MIKAICVDLYPNGDKKVFVKEFMSYLQLTTFLLAWRELSERYNGYDFACAEKVIFPDGRIQMSLLWREEYDKLKEDET